jgi:ABC-type transport system involved in multi-copper enzyme maturation permease subunit
MIGATAWTIAGRKGSFLGGAAISLLVVVAAAVARAIVNARDPDTHPSVGGAVFLEAAGGLVFFASILVGVLMGALAGSYDTSQGTMRYLVMTGASRAGIFASRAAALVASVYLAVLPAVVLMLALAFLLPRTAGEALSAHDVLAGLWSIALFAGVYALVSLGIGSLLRSNGAAIAVALVINFALAPLIVLLAAWSETAASLTLPVVLATLVGDDTEIGIPVAAAALAGWLALFLGAGWARVARDEY